LNAHYTQVHSLDNWQSSSSSILLSRDVKEESKWLITSLRFLSKNSTNSINPRNCVKPRNFDIQLQSNISKYIAKKETKATIRRTYLVRERKAFQNGLRFDKNFVQKIGKFPEHNAKISPENSFTEKS